MASELAAYYVSIVPSAKGLTGKIAKEFAGVDREAAKSGKSSGAGFASAFKGSMAGIAGAFAAVGIGSFVKDAVNAAGSLEQSVGAISSVFGSSAKDMQKWSKSAATNVGLTANEFNELGTLIGSQLKNGGTAMEDLAPKTNELIGLGADLSSMFGGSAKDAVDALSSALKGERDPIEKYGVSLNQAKIDAEAAALGFEKVEGALSAEATQAATMSLIMKQTGDAHGNFAKESDTFAHKQQVMSAQWGNLTTKVGELFLPAITGVIGFISEKAVPVFTEIVGGVKAFGAAWVANDGDITSDGFAGVMEQLAYWGRQAFETVIPMVKDFGGLLSDTFGPALERVGGFLRDTVVPNLQVFGGYIVSDILPALQNIGKFILEEVIPALGRFSTWLLDNLETIKNVAIGIAVILLPALVRLGVGALISAGKQVVAWAMAQGGAIKAGVVYVAQSILIIGRWAAMAVGATVNGVKIAAVWTAQIIGSAVKGAVAMGIQAGRVVGAWLLMSAQSLIHAGRMALAWVIAMGPIGWIIAAVVGLVALVIANWDTISKFTAEVWANISKWVTDAINFVVAWVQSKVLWLQAMWHMVWTTIKNKVAEIWKGITSAISGAINFVVAWVQSRILFMQAVWHMIWTTIRNKATEIWNGIKKGISDAINYVVTWVQSKILWLQSVWHLAWTLIKNKVTEIWNGVKNTIKDVWEKHIKPIFDTVSKAVKEALPKAFEAGVAAVKTAWEKIQDIAKAPVKFVVNTVINDGLIAGFNNIAGPLGVKKLDKVALPHGFHDGGYTGRLHHKAVAGVVHGDEHVIKSASRRRIERTNPGLLDHMNRTGQLPTDGCAHLRGRAAATAPFAGQSPDLWGSFQDSIRSARRLYVAGNVPGWSVPAAINAWNGKANVSVRGGRGNPQSTIGGATWMPPNILGYAFEDGSISLNTNSGHSPTLKRAVSTHEIGHVLGLPHTTGRNSIMHPLLANAMQPTAFDVANLQRMYGVPGGATIPGAPSTGDDGGGGFNPIAGIIDGLVQKFKDTFKDAGLIADLAIGIGKKLLGDVSKWVGAKFGFGGAAATVYDGGGWLENTGGAQLVQHNKRKPDAVLSSGQWDTMTRIADNAKGGFNNYGTIHVRDEEEAARIILTRQRDAQAAYGF